MVDLIGYIALSLNLTSMAMKKIVYLRICSMTANLLYVVYGLLLGAMPMAIGGSVAMLIHCYWIRRLVMARAKEGIKTKK